LQQQGKNRELQKLEREFELGMLEVQMREMCKTTKLTEEVAVKT